MKNFIINVVKEYFAPVIFLYKHTIGTTVGKWVLLILVSAILGYLRVDGEKSLFFQGVAHIYVGGLYGAWFSGKKKLCPYLAIGLTVLEIICASQQFIK